MTQTVAAQPQLQSVPMPQPSMQPDSSACARRVALVRQFMREQMVAGEDYGVIPGTSQKPTLFKPGADKINLLFALAPHVEILRRDENWDAKKPYVSYDVKVALLNKRTGAIEAEGVGHCNSRERKYGSQDAANVANTVLKMAKKRALIDATLSATGANCIFSSPSDSIATGDEDVPQRDSSQAISSQRKAQNAPQHKDETREWASKEMLDRLVLMARGLWGGEWKTELQRRCNGKPINRLTRHDARQANGKLRALRDAKRIQDDAQSAAPESNAPESNAPESNAPVWNGDNDSPGQQRAARQQASARGALVRCHCGQPAQQRGNVFVCGLDAGKGGGTCDFKQRVGDTSEPDALLEPKTSQPPAQGALVYDIPRGTPQKQCAGCRATIVWIRTDAGKAMPCNLDGTPHWSTCPNREEFQAQRKAKREAVAKGEAQHPQIVEAFRLAVEKGLYPGPGARTARIQATNRLLLDHDLGPVDSWSELTREGRDVLLIALDDGLLTWESGAKADSGVSA